MILVIVDRFSKFVDFLLFKNPFIANIITMVFLQDIIKLHGFP